MLARDTSNLGLYLYLPSQMSVDLGAVPDNFEGIADYAGAINNAVNGVDFSRAANVATTVNFGDNQVTRWDHVRLEVAPSGATYVNITDDKYTVTWGAAETTAYAGGDASGYDLP